MLSFILIYLFTKGECSLEALTVLVMTRSLLVAKLESAAGKVKQIPSVADHGPTDRRGGKHYAQIPQRVKLWF